jgi:uncharacterized protein (TIGR03118 family)
MSIAKNIRISSATALLFATGIAAMLVMVFAGPSSPQGTAPAVTIISPSKQSPVQTNLVSDIPGLAVTTDPNLVNPWGIANSATSPYWISDQGTDRSTLYNGFGAITNLVVEVPPVGNPSGPTGIIAVPAGTTGFVVPGTTSTSKFIFATLDGTIAAWTAGNAVTAATQAGAAFTGLAFANNGTANYLYAANFVSGGTIQVFDSTFTAAALTGTFTDPGVPGSYAPFNIQLIGSDLYVTFAQVAAPGGPNFGSGLGYVDVFDTNGNLVNELVANGQLNAPWGVAMSPAGFAAFPSDLLVGNFGNGQINAFNPTNGTFLGTIENPEGKVLVNSGLWAIEFGNGNAGSSPNTLYLNAGINGERDGLFAAITPGPVMLTFAGQLVNTASAAQTVTVENTGSAALVLSAAPALSGTQSTDFTIGGTSTCTNAASIAPGGACTIVVTFTPAAAGSRGPVTLTIADNASSSPQTVTLSGTGSAGAPATALAPTTPLTFTGQIVGSNSTTQTVTITNSGNAPLTFGATAVAVSNDFSQTNTCNGQTVAVNANCTVTVTFTPSATTNNPRTGTLTVTDNAANSPQAVALTGTGWDFGVSTPTTATATRGTASSITATVSALGGFTGSVAMTCTGTIPQGGCAVSPASLTVPGSATVTFTTAAFMQPAPREVPPISPVQIVLLFGAALLLLSLPAVRQARTRLTLAGAVLVFLVAAGCSNNNNANSSTATPAGQYQVTVTGTSGGVTRSSNVTLTVNQ